MVLPGDPACLAYSSLACLLVACCGFEWGGLSPSRFRGFGRENDDRLQFMYRQDALLENESFDAGDVSQVWLTWSGAAEAALADAYRFSGGPSPDRGLVLGRGRACFRVVRLGGQKVRKVRDAADVFLYRDSSVAPLLDVRRRFKAVVDVLGAMIRSGISLSRVGGNSLLSATGFLLAGPLYLVTLDDLSAVRGFDIGDFHPVVS